MRNPSLLKPAIFGFLIASSAAFGNTPSITVGDGAGQPNTDVTIDVSFENTAGGDVVGFQFDINYDATNLTPDITNCGTSAQIFCSIITNPLNAVRVFGDGAGQAIASGSLGTVDFAITNNAALIGTTETLTVTNDLFSDDGGNPVAAGTLTNGTITIQAAPAPAITVAPASGTFSAANGSTDTETFTVTNSGNADGLTVSSAVISGADNANFDVTSNNCPTSGGLAQSATCSIVVTFSPDAVDTFNATLEIVSSGGGENIALTGTGTLGPVGTLTVTPETFNFGELLTGIDTAQEVFTATNTGQAGSVVTISSAALNPLLGSPLAIDNKEITGNTCTNGTELEKDESCQVTVTYTPIATGLAGRTLTVSGTDANGTAVSDSADITGTGIEEARPNANPAFPGASESEVVGPEGSNDFTVVWTNAGNISYDVSCALTDGYNTDIWSLANESATVEPEASHTVTTTCALPDTETYTETLTCTVTNSEQQTVTYTYNYECVGLPPLPVPVDNKWALALLALMMLMAASFGFRFIARQ